MTENVGHRSISNVFPGHSLSGRVERTGGDEELGAIGILPSVSHGKETRLAVLQLEVFVWIGGPVQETIKTEYAHISSLGDIWFNVPANFSP